MAPVVAYCSRLPARGAHGRRVPAWMAPVVAYCSRPRVSSSPPVARRRPDGTGTGTGCPGQAGARRGPPLPDV